METTAYFDSEKKAQAACKSLKKSGINEFRLIHNYDADTLRFVTDKNPAGLYFGTGTVKVPGIGLVSGQTIENQKLVGFNSYSSFLNVSGSKKGVMLSYKNSPEADGIIQSHGGVFPDF